MRFTEAAIDRAARRLTAQESTIADRALSKVIESRKTGNPMAPMTHQERDVLVRYLRDIERESRKP